VNWQHFRAFLWLRWRLRINQLKRAGTANAVILAGLVVFALCVAAGLFVGSFLIGLFLLGDVSPPILLLVWDGIVVAFLFFWGIGVVTDLQQAEVLSLDKFLHLPVSLSGVFLINYLSSLVNLTLVVFLPAMLALSLALVFTRGPAMLLVLPLLTAFLLMVTALTHQFRGWLAALMVNKRRRGTIIAVVTIVFVLLAQMPNLLNIMRPWQQEASKEAVERGKREAEQREELSRLLGAGKITFEEYRRRLEKIDKDREAKNKEINEELEQRVETTARFLSLVLPPGWLAYGAMASAQGNVVPALLGTLGLALIGTASLWRAYRTTLRLYTGQFTTGEKKAAAAAAVAPSLKTGKPGRYLLETKLPWLSEEASVIALGSFRSLLRAPEAKIALLTPIFMVIIFGALFAQQSNPWPEAPRPLPGFAAIAMTLLGLVQLAGNQFGFDRDGFRVFVLCAAPRRDILLGKNLAFLPIVFTMAVPMIALVQVFQPLRIDHLLALLPQMITMFLSFCVGANCLSILAPLRVAPGAMKAANVKGVAVLLHLAFVFIFPLLLAPALLPLGVEAVLDVLGVLHGWPICLLLSLVECAIVVVLYRLVLTLEGQLLQAREQRILELVTGKGE
jgi:hypothetical protein